MVPSGQILGRTCDQDGEFYHMETVSVVGDSVRIWKSAGNGSVTPYEEKLSQTFGSGTLALLRGLRVGVVGCSGTGSIIVELLVRNGVGTLVVVDSDVMDAKNLNRIVNGTIEDANEALPKVIALRRAIQRIGIGTKVDAYEQLTNSRNVIAALVDCDVVFGCVDSAFGRYHLDCLASAYYIPYFDVGVYLEADGMGAIAVADAVSHYMHPDGASLLSRGAYTVEQVAAENMQRHDPEHYELRLEAGYLAAVGEEQPAVMSVNMQAACMAFNDFMARIHHYRLDSNREFSTQRFRLVHGSYDVEGDTGGPHPLLGRYAGMADNSVLIQNNISQ